MAADRFKLVRDCLGKCETMPLPCFDVLLWISQYSHFSHFLRVLSINLIAQIHTNNCGCLSIESWDAEKQLCCGKIPERKILNKTNDQNLCCSYDQYDPKKQCCTDDVKVVSLHDCEPKIQSPAGWRTYTQMMSPKAVERCPSVTVVLIC